MSQCYIPEEFRESYEVNEEVLFATFELAVEQILHVHYMYSCLKKNPGDPSGIDIIEKIASKIIHVCENDLEATYDVEHCKWILRNMPKFVELIKNGDTDLYSCMVVLFNLEELQCYGY